MNLLGRRETHIYGTKNWTELQQELEEITTKWQWKLKCFQSNSEGEIVDKIQTCMDAASALIINPAAYTHTSIAIKDALAMLKIPVIEVHLSNILAREQFRSISFTASHVTGIISGFGSNTYKIALLALKEIME